jgi:malonyl-CoA decarboxylase
MNDLAPQHPGSDGTPEKGEAMTPVRRRFALSNLVSGVRDEIRRRLGTAPGEGASAEVARILELCDMLLSHRGDSSAVQNASAILTGYAALPDPERIDFLSRLARGYGPDPAALDRAIAAYRADPGSRTAADLHQASEPRRQQVIRTLNLAPGATAMLLRMRQDALKHQKEIADFEALDGDFRHLLSSWFNGGFLVLHRIEWTSPGAILAKIIDYEAVHAIQSWDELQRRVAPTDRRCYAFFHPKLPDEPLIFVEVALTQAIPASVDVLLAKDRVALSAEAATTAVFYSISNCQVGLRGIPFGGFLIKQVVELLKAELPSLNTFITLSPLPGFARWLKRERALGADGALAEAELSALQALDSADWQSTATDGLKSTLRSAAARYLLEGRSEGGQLADPVARFHIGNGARLEQVNWLGDSSVKGLRDYHGILVNYLYDLKQIEKNYQSLSERDEVPASSTVRKLARKPSANRKLMFFSRPATPAIAGEAAEESA